MIYLQQKIKTDLDVPYEGTNYLAFQIWVWFCNYWKFYIKFFLVLAYHTSITGHWLPATMLIAFLIQQHILIIGSTSHSLCWLCSH